MRKHSHILSTLSLLGAMHVSTVLAQSSPTVTVAVAKDWQSAIETPLYCSGSTPFQQSISSHAHAGVLWMLPSGSHVKKGTVIAQQDDFYLRQQLAQLTTDIELVKMRYQFALDEYERLRGMTSNNMVSKSELQSLKLDYRSAELQKKRLEQQRTTLDYQLSHLKHLAPSDGVITQLNVEPGTWVVQGQALLTFLPSEQQEISCQVDVSWYQGINSQKQLAFSLENQPLRIKRQAGVVNQGDQTLQISLAPIQPLADPIRVGQRYRITVAHQEKGLVRVPHDALLIESKQSYIWRVNIDDELHQVEKVPVTIIRTEADSVIVQSSIVVDDRVVVHGKKGLTDSLNVTIDKSAS